MLPFRTEYLDFPDIRLHIRHWGADDAPRLFLLHGWMDVSASWQFMVDALAEEWHCIAPDWRGFGNSQWLNRPYHFAEHISDLEQILNHYSPEESVRLVGHSMGGIISTLYAGLRPERVHRVATLEGFGLAPTQPAMAADRYRQWLNETHQPPKMRVYTDRATFARRLQKKDARLSAVRASFLARHLARLGQGRDRSGRLRQGIVFNADPWHKNLSPYLFQLDEAMAIWQEVLCPVLWVAARQSWMVRDYEQRPGDWQARQACFRNLKECFVDDSDHMMHHDQPETVARVVEQWLMDGGTV